MRAKIHWTNDEIERIASRYLELKIADINLGEGAGLREAQKVLPENRRRRGVGGLSQVPQVAECIASKYDPSLINNNTMVKARQLELAKLLPGQLEILVARIEQAMKELGEVSAQFVKMYESRPEDKKSEIQEPQPVVDLVRIRRDIHRVVVDLGALVPDPSNIDSDDWPCQNQADRERLQSAFVRLQELDSDLAAASN